ncbi:COA8 family protein CBG23705, mitochondrial-like [Hydractinia symbiolongicarpus]|uniref:COA8 family protein CBG23705, mitochondrial-like n=1 Tax=Hydractinia symbiolongicarpus TaxID=13093 RepID=UPI00254D1811|nr:COA8 family protein CBG23705, mitochondrial-like [Hydractinia symbiolongicarpus]
MLTILSRRCPICLRISSRYLTDIAAAKQEKPIKLVSSNNQGKFDLVSPPDPDSNIRKIIFGRSNKTTKVEEKLIDENSKTYEWNNQFWKEHNKLFFEEKKKFLEREKVVSGSNKEVSDKLSIFYKEFLEKNHDVYMQYNREWYRKNFNLLWISFRASIIRLITRS